MNSSIRVQPYVRVSSEKQETHSPAAQVSIAKSWCENLGYQNLEAIVETGSGESIENRPGILRALDYAKRKSYEILFCVELSRIARKMEDAVSIIDLFRAQGIKVATPSKVFDYGNYNDTFLAHITSSIDELERQKIRERSMRGRRHAKKSGAYIGEFLPYGFKTIKEEDTGTGRHVSKIVHDEKEIVGLRHILKLAKKGYSSRDIAKEMTYLGYKTKFGKSDWNKASINGILKNTWLYGEAQFFKKESFKNKGKRIYVPQPREDWIIHSVPAVISKDEYQLIQKLISKRTLNSKKQTAFDYLLMDKLTCGYCYSQAKKRGELHRSTRIGHRTDWYVHTDKNGVKTKEPRYPYYVCVGRSRHLRDWKCSLPQIRAGLLDDLVWDETKRFLSNPKIIHDAVVVGTQEAKEHSAEYKSSVDQAQKELASIESKKKTAKRKFATTDAISKSDFEDIINELDEEIASISKRIDNLKKEGKAPPKPKIPFKSIKSACDALLKSFDYYDFDMKRNVVDMLYENIVVDLDWTVTLQGRIPLEETAFDNFQTGDRSAQQVADAGFQVHFY